MILGSLPTIIDIDPFSTSTVQAGQLGSRIDTGDGRTFRYALAGASNISKGKVQLAPAQKANHHNIAVSTAAASGANEVSVTLGATAAVAGEYNEGFMAVNDVAGEGQVYKISTQPAIDSAGTGTLTLFDRIATALTTSSEVSLVHNNWSSVVEAAVSTRRAAGAPLVSITAANYGWLQTRGVAATLCDTTTTLGAKQKVSGSVAGAVTDMTDILGASAEVEIGTASIMAGVDTEYRPIVLTID